MGTFKYENVGSSTYLVYELDYDEQIDSTSLGMISNNSISGVAKMFYSQIDHKKFLKFDVSAKISADQLLTGPVEKKRIVGLFKGIVSALMEAEDYMLDSSSFILDMKFIFTNISATDVSVVCLPVIGKRNDKDLQSFLRETLFTIQFADPSESFIGQILNYLNTQVGFSLEGFYELLQGVGEPRRERHVASEETNKANNALYRSEQKPSAENMQTPRAINNVPIQQAIPQSSPAIYPNVAIKEQPLVQNSRQTKKEEKEISWFYLMQHYNKENAALYKAQKEKKKSGNNNKASKKKSTNKDKAKRSNIANVGFDIPGQSSAQPVQSFAPSIQQSIPRAPKPQNVIAGSAVQSPAQHTYGVPYAQANQPFTASSADFGDTVFAGADDDETTRFDDRSSQPSAISPTLIRKRNNERIRIDSPVFRIGRDSGFNNYAVTDNRYVGHTHCHIVSRGGEFFLVDDNSKNHTFLDGQQITPSTEIKLSHGQKFRLSDEEFEFLLY